MVAEWLRNRAYHSWVDPRNFTAQDGWVWAELNMFHSADVARQILEDVDNAILDAEYIRKKERGEIDEDKFKSMWNKIIKRKEDK